MDLRYLPQYKSKDSSLNIEDYLKNDKEQLNNTITIANFLSEDYMDKNEANLTENQDFITEFATTNNISEYEMKNLMEGKIQYWRL